ncbi:MAG: hypothetical protein GXO89_06390 [Chlorobi bacterium]|nr:hypothetical protein [Chlorobiota bacterium]
MNELHLRQKIFKLIRNVPPNKLSDLLEYITTLEKSIEKQSKVLSYASSWNDIDDSAFDELTTDLISNRSRNTKRHNE